MTDLLIGLIVVAIIGAAIGYIYKEKKRGVKCVGCPDAGRCAAAKRMGSTSCSGCGANLDYESNTDEL